MTPAIQQEILKRLSGLCDMSSDIRFGQLISQLSFLAEDQFDQSLWDIDDERFLEVIERHRLDLLNHQALAASKAG